MRIGDASPMNHPHQAHSKRRTHRNTPPHEADAGTTQRQCVLPRGRRQGFSRGGQPLERTLSPISLAREKSGPAERPGPAGPESQWAAEDSGPYRVRGRPRRRHLRPRGVTRSPGWCSTRRRRAWAPGGRGHRSPCSGPPAPAGAGPCRGWAW